MLSVKRGSFLVRTGLTVLLITIMFLGTIAPSLAAGRSIASHAQKTNPPTANHCSKSSKKGCPSRTGAGVSPNVDANNTGQATIAKPSIEWCNGRLYVGWTGTDGQLNVAWGSTGGTFPSGNVVTFYGVTAYENQNANPSIFTGPALKCWTGANGLGQMLYIAWTAAQPSREIEVGAFDGKPEDHYILHEYPAGGNTSNYSPALTIQTYNNRLFLAFTGTDSKIYVTSSSDGQHWGPQNQWSGETSVGGLGFAYGGTSLYPLSLWIVWIGADSSHSLNLGSYNSSNGTFTPYLTFFYYSQMSYDASLTSSAGTFYIPYSGENDDLNVLYTSGTVWSNNTYIWSSGEGASLTFDPNDGNYYIVWREAGFFTNEMDLSTYP